MDYFKCDRTQRYTLIFCPLIKVQLGKENGITLRVEHWDSIQQGLEEYFNQFKRIEPKLRLNLISAAF